MKIPFPPLQRRMGEKNLITTNAPAMHIDGKQGMMANGKRKMGTTELPCHCHIVSKRNWRWSIGSVTFKFLKLYIDAAVKTGVGTINSKQYRQEFYSKMQAGLSWVIWHFADDCKSNCACSITGQVSYSSLAGSKHNAPILILLNVLKSAFPREGLRRREGKRFCP